VATGTFNPGDRERAGCSPHDDRPLAGIGCTVLKSSESSSMRPHPIHFDFFRIAKGLRIQTVQRKSIYIPVEMIP
jgi:hypothetical protein